MAGFVVLAGNGIGGTGFRRPPFFRGAKKVGIVGSTYNNRYTPWWDPAWLLVSHTCSRADCRREPDWYFDLHRPECFKQKKRWNPRYYEWLQTLQTPIFMQEEWPEIPMAVRYPLERITAEYKTSVTGRLAATNHAAYMFPLAMSEGVETIGLFGCQYSAAEDRGPQRDSLLYWMGRYEEWGGKLVVPEPNSLLAVPKGLYGYESHDEHGKLTPEYSAKVTPTQASPAVPVIQAHGTVVNDTSVDGRGALTPPPNGDAIAWNRSGLKVAG